MTIFFNVFLPVVLVAGLAALLQRLVYLDARTVARAAFYLFGPALVFDSLASSDVGAVEFGQISVVLSE